MTSVEYPDGPAKKQRDGPAKKGRRKWGWIFVALFFLQAVAFGSAHLSATSRSSRAYNDAYSLDVSKLRDAAARTYGRAQDARREAGVYLGLLVVGSLICVIGAALGFRRYK